MLTYVYFLPFLVPVFFNLASMISACWALPFFFPQRIILKGDGEFFLKRIILKGMGRWR